MLSYLAAGPFDNPAKNLRFPHPVIFRKMKGSPFLDHVREVIRINHFSYSTEKTYISWMYRFIIFHNKRHPKEMGGKEIADFLTNLAVERKVSASTQNQALNALVFSKWVAIK
jgi:hypothetical protein